MSDQEYISKVLNIVADKLGIDKSCDFESRLSVLYLIKEKNEILFNELNRIINTFIVYGYVKSDREMKEKMREMWEQERDSRKAEWEAERDRMMDVLREHKISAE